MKNFVRPVLACAIVAAIAASPAAARAEGFRLQDRFAAPPVTEASVSETIVDLAIATPELSTLVQAVLKAGLAETLDQDGDFTVFAPTNAAFEAAGIDPTNVDEATLTAVLLDHVASGKFTSKFLRSQARSGQRVATLGGLSLGIDAKPFAINGQAVLISDIKAANGRVYVIDGVLTRPAPSIAARAIATDSLSTLVEAVVKAGLVPTLDEEGPFTVFAPTNEAFERAGIDPAIVDAETLAAVLADHVVPGNFTSGELVALRLSGSSLRSLGSLDLAFRIFPFKVNGIRILASNISAANGTIYVIDRLLLDDEN